LRKQKNQGDVKKMRKLKESMTKKKAALICTVLLAVCILVGFVHKQSEIKSYKEWMNIHSYELYKEWSRLGDGFAEGANIMIVDVKIYEALYRDVPNDKNSEDAHELYIEAMALYEEALEQFERGSGVNTDLIGQADIKIDEALDIIND
jgi:hypothetical protein